jgi:hypothetical protein
VGCKPGPPGRNTARNSRCSTFVGRMPCLWEPGERHVLRRGCIHVVKHLGCLQHCHHVTRHKFMTVPSAVAGSRHMPVRVAPATFLYKVCGVCVRTCVLHFFFCLSELLVMLSHRVACVRLEEVRSARSAKRICRVLIFGGAQLDDQCITGCTGVNGRLAEL